MAAFRLRLNILQGETWRQRLVWKAGKPPLPVDLSGCTARMHMRRQVDAAEVLVDLSSADGRIALGGAAGTVDLTLSAEETAALAFRQAVYDIEITFPGGDVRRLAQGQVAVSPEVTRA